MERAVFRERFGKEEGERTCIKIGDSLVVVLSPSASWSHPRVPDEEEKALRIFTDRNVLKKMREKLDEFSKGHPKACGLRVPIPVNIEGVQGNVVEKEDGGFLFFMEDQFLGR